jgi:hypothetical protein
MVDLSKIEGTLVDPTISAVTWGPQLDGADMREVAASSGRTAPSNCSGTMRC